MKIFLSVWIFFSGTGKDGKFTLSPAMESQRVQSRSPVLSLSSTLVVVGGQRHGPAALPAGKRPVTIVQEAGWAPVPVWTCVENLVWPKLLHLVALKIRTRDLRLLFMNRNVSMEDAASFTVELISSHDSKVCGLNFQSYEVIDGHISCVVCAKAQNTETSAMFWLQNRKTRFVVCQYFILKPCYRVRWVHRHSFIFWQCLVKCCHSQTIVGSVLICKEDIKCNWNIWLVLIIK